MQKRRTLLKGIAATLGFTGSGVFSPLAFAIEEILRDGGIELSYPPTRREEFTEEHWGRKFHVPYHWLADPGDPEVKNWIDAQDELSKQVLGNERVRDKISALAMNEPVIERPLKIIRQGGREFFWRGIEGKSKPGLYVRFDLESAPRLLLDPNTLSQDGSLNIPARFVFVSPDGKKIAYAVETVGSFFRDVRILEVDSGRHIDGEIKGVIGPKIAWHHASEGFYYNLTSGFSLASSRADHPDGVYWHELHSSHDQDKLVREYSWAGGHTSLPSISADGNYLIVEDRNYANRLNGFHIQPLDGDGEFVTVIPNGEGTSILIDNIGDTFYFETVIGTVNGYVVAIDINKPGQSNWREVVAERKGVPAGIESVYFETNSAIFGDEIFVVYSTDAHHTAEIFDINGNHRRSIAFPYHCSVYSTEHNKKAGTTDLQIISFLIPIAKYRLKISDASLTLLSQTGAPPDVSDYQISQVFYSSKDGTRVPMFLIGRKDHSRADATPVLLYGYGGYGMSSTPIPEKGVLTWLRMGGMYAIANIRGGGEYGEKWHHGGWRDKKQNSFDDFHAAAEFLIGNGYVKPERLAIRGLSNGGLLVTTCFNQRPELYGAVVAEIPQTNPLEIGGSPTIAIGSGLSERAKAGEGELGNPFASEKMFNYILAYSPNQNVRKRKRNPALLLTVAEKDSPGLTGGAYQFVAEVQYKSNPGEPVLLRIARGVGHQQDFWLPEQKRTTIIDQYTFLVMNLDADFRI